MEITRQELSEAHRLGGETMKSLAARVKEALENGKPPLVIEPDGAKQPLVVEEDGEVNWIGGMRNCQVCGMFPELFKVKDEVWYSAGLAPSDCTCIPCLIKLLGRDLCKDDADTNYPWWNRDRPDYYEGFNAGLVGYSGRPFGTTSSEFNEGFYIGSWISGSWKS